MCKEAFYFKNILGSLSFETLIFLEGGCSAQKVGFISLRTLLINYGVEVDW